MGLQHMCGSLRFPGHVQCLALPAAAVVSLIALYRFISWKNRNQVKDKIVLITGASSGIGKACAEAFHRAGAKLILVSRTEANLIKVRDELEKLCPGHTPEVVTMDVSDYASIRQAAQSVLSRHGHVDILINNAGQSFRGPTIDTDISVHERVMKVNYFGQIVLTQELLPSMIKHGGGDIVVVSSLQGKIYVPFRAAYGASKHALECYFDALRAEHHDDGIRVLVCSPGYTKTDLSYQSLTADGTHYGQMDQNLARGMPADYVARGILTGVQYRTKHLIVGPIHHKVACYMPNVLWNVMALVMRIKARKDRTLYKKSD